MTGAWLLPLILTSQVDLRPTQVEAQAATFLAQEDFVVVLGIDAGSFQGDVDVRIWASSDQVIDPNDTLLIDTMVSVTTATASFELSAPTPGPTGTFFALAELDPNDAVDEDDETNNDLASVDTFTLAGLDMEVERLILQTSPPLILGSTRSYRIDVINRGPSLATGLEVGLFLRPAGASEVPLVSFTPLDDLAANTRDVLSGVYVVPPAAPDGAAEIIARLRIGEPVRETDPGNDLAVQQVVLVDPLPNLRGVISSAPASAEAGTTITVQRAVENNGVEDGTTATEVLLVLSLDENIETTDLVLARETTPRLLEGELDVRTSVLELPLTLTSTTYRLGLILDAPEAERETIESDNEILGPLIDVFPPDLGIVTSTLPVARTGTAYEVALIGVGGTVARTWSIPDAQLPTGLSLDQVEGIIEGVPLQEGLYPLDIQLRSGPAQVERRIDLRVADPTLPLQVGQSSLPPTVVGRSYQIELVAQGGLPPYRWSSAALPPGLGLSPAGRLAGAPSAEGEFMVTVQVEDDLGEQAFAALPFRVVAEGDGVSFLTESLPDAVLGAAYEARVEASGGAEPFVFSGGGLPPGIELAEDGGLSGRPTEVGDFDFTLTVRNQLGIVSSRRFSLQVNDDDRLRILSEILPAGRVGQAYDVALMVEGGAPPLQWRRFGEEILPPGLSLDEAGLIAGTPTASNVYRFAVEVRDAMGRIARAPLELRIEGETPPPPPPGGGGCRSGGGANLMWLLLAPLLLSRARARRGAREGRGRRP